MGKLEGKVAIITGCSSGIGKQIAIRYAEEGAKLSICARRMEKLEETAAACRKRGAEVMAMSVDVSVMEQLESFVDATAKRFGTVDILINNAMSGVPYLPLEEVPLEHFDHFMNTMLHGTVRMMQLCFPYMKGKESAIINLGSSASLGGDAEDYHQSAYGTMKGAVAALTRCAAREWGKYGIRANVLYPIAMTEAISDPNGRHKDSGIEAEMSKNAFHRAGDTYRDVSPVAVFLGSSDSAFVTGQSLRAEGGRYMGVC